MRKLMLVSVGALLGACSGQMTAPGVVDGPDAAARSAVERSVAGTYVLTRLETQASAPFFIFDHQCADGVHRQLAVLGDTVVIGSDGTGRRGFALAQITNGVSGEASYTEWSGHWQSFDATGWYFYGGSPSIEVTGAIRGTPVNIRLRIDSPSTLSTPASMGGSCVGVPTDGREVVAVYTKI